MEPRQLDPTILEDREIREGSQVKIREDTKTVDDWIDGKVREGEAKGVTGNIQRQLREWWSDTANMRKNDWAVNIREHNNEADAWAKREPVERKETGRMKRKLSGRMSARSVGSAMAVVGRLGVVQECV